MKKPNNNSSGSTSAAGGSSSTNAESNSSGSTSSSGGGVTSSSSGGNSSSSNSSGSSAENLTVPPVVNSSNSSGTGSTTTVGQLSKNKQKKQQQQQNAAKKSASTTSVVETPPKPLIDVDEELENDAFFTNRLGKSNKPTSDTKPPSSSNSSSSKSNNNLEEVDLNSLSNTTTNNIYPVIQQQPSSHQAYLSHHPNVVVQAVQPIQTVQPYPNSSVLPLQQQQNQQLKGKTNVSLNKQSLDNSVNSVDLNASLDESTAAMLAFNSTNANTSTTTLTFLEKQAMLQPQSLDNNAIHKLLMDETKSVLVLDDNEALQVKSTQEFLNLFKSSQQPPQTQQPQQQQQQQHYHQLQPNQQQHQQFHQPLLLQNNINTNATLNPGNISPNSLAAASPNEDKLVKCVSIFGNTGDGKSHTLNHTFFNGRPIFRTSTKQETCTMGVWCAYDPVTNSLIFDTEGLLGTTCNENKRMRLLLKVLAISDVIIYRTRAERLHNDLFKFLSDASQAYLKYFSKELKAAAVKLKLDTISALGPDCVIFHETQHTEPLCDQIDGDGHELTVSHQLRDRFAKLDLSYNAFSSIEYVGTRTSLLTNAPEKMLLVSTDFTKLAQSVRYLLKNNSVRPPRKLSSIYHVLKVLNDKFNGIITKNQISTFADEYFTCNSLCLSCGKRCQNSINHLKDGILHENSEKCHYHHQYDNKVYVCKYCHEAGKEVIVIPKTAASNDNSLIGIVKYTYSGYVLECPHHGIIYRSRQYWYGNPDPESVVRTELKHIWSGQQNNVGTSHNLSRKIIDNVSYIGDTLQSISAKPTSIAKQWMADKVAPAYWVPNSEITECFKCKKEFTTEKKKHHCRGCGKGFCDKCSAKRKIIPWWSLIDTVRVCDSCFDKENIEEPNMPTDTQNRGSQNRISEINNSNNSLAALGISGNQDVIVRKVTESVQETIGYIGYATKLPLDVLKESARPSYWKPDSDCLKCAICHKEFDDMLLLHHCRSCGNGVCHACSPHLRPVPSRGWETPVRVCNNCVSNEISN